jgi:hypothetical protein
MAVAIAPERPGGCAGVRAHGGCDAVREFVATACTLCGEPIGYRAACRYHTGWRHFGHRDSWATLAHEQEGAR